MPSPITTIPTDTDLANKGSIGEGVLYRKVGTVGIFYREGGIEKAVVPGAGSSEFTPGTPTENRLYLQSLIDAAAPPTTLVNDARYQRGFVRLPAASNDEPWLIDQALEVYSFMTITGDGALKMTDDYADTSLLRLIGNIGIQARHITVYDMSFIGPDTDIVDPGNTLWAIDAQAGDQWMNCTIEGNQFRWLNGVNAAPALRLFNFRFDRNEMTGHCGTFYAGAAQTGRIGPNLRFSSAGPTGNADPVFNCTGGVAGESTNLSMSFGIIEGGDFNAHGKTTAIRIIQVDNAEIDWFHFEMDGYYDISGGGWPDYIYPHSGGTRQDALVAIELDDCNDLTVGARKQMTATRAPGTKTITPTSFGATLFRMKNCRNIWIPRARWGGGPRQFQFLYDGTARVAAGEVMATFDFVQEQNARKSLTKYDAIAGTHTTVEDLGVVSYPPTLVFDNGDFRTSTNWNLNGVWTIGSGVATAGTGRLTKLIEGAGLVNGRTYRIDFRVPRWVSGNVKPQLSNAADGLGGVVAGTDVSAVGNYTQFLIAGSASKYVGFNASSTPNLDIDNVQISLVA